MPGPDQYPPPGAPGDGWDKQAPQQVPAPGQLPAARGQHPAWAGPPPPGAVAPRPGAVPLRPLGLGDILDGAVKIVRHNAGATVGASLLVGALAMAVPVVTTFLLWAGTGLSGALDPMTSEDPLASDTNLAATLGVLASWLAGFAVQYLGVMLVTGMVVHVTAAAALGRTVSLGEAWAATAGKRLRLVGLVLLLGFLTTLALTIYVVLCVAVVLTESVGLIVGWFLVTLPLLVAASLWFWIKVSFLPAAVIVAEDAGVLTAVSRGARLVTGHFWRVLGIALLITVLVQVVAGIIATPLSFLGVLPPLLGASPELALLVSVGAQVLSVVLVTAVTTPFVAATTALLHLDLRMRKEAYDVELIQQAGLGQR